MYANVVAPKFLDWIEYFSPLGKGGDGVAGIANMTVPILFGASIIISAERMDPIDENHEAIHCWQSLEIGILGYVITCVVLSSMTAPWWAFVVAAVQAWSIGIGWMPLAYGTTFAYWYLRMRWLGLPNPGLKAYFLVPFEREAYLYDQDLTYLSERKRFAWLFVPRLEASSHEKTRAKHLMATFITLKS